MRYELLARMADIINVNSTRYYAVVPSARYTYIMQVDDKLVKTECFVLRVKLVARTGGPRHRRVWNIFTIDFDKIIHKMAYRDPSFADRIRRCEPNIRDVEILVRRASFRSLKLNIAPSAFGL